MAAYYRVAQRMQRLTSQGLEPCWMFVSTLYVDRSAVYSALNMVYKDPTTIVVAGTTPERVDGHLIRFVGGQESVVWARRDFLNGIPTDERAVREAEEAVYQPAPETGESAALDARRMEFYKWLVQTGQLNEGKEESV